VFTVYVLFSYQHKKIYIGFSSDLKNRLDSHNIYSKKGYTAKFRPWKVLFTEEYKSKKEAIIREKQLKTARGREHIWEMVHQKYKL
jgi:putative endonuclease